MQATLGPSPAGASDDDGKAAGAPADLATLFEAHAAWAGRTLRCLGVPESELADAIQEVFLVVHRRLDTFEGRSSHRTWIYAICLRVALAHRRRGARRREHEREGAAAVAEAQAATTPHDEVERLRALALALEILDGLDDPKRAVFVLYEVEQVAMPEIARMVGCPVQTAYTRLYAARAEVKRALARMRARGRTT